MYDKNIHIIKNTYKTNISLISVKIKIDDIAYYYMVYIC